MTIPDHELAARYAQLTDEELLDLWGRGTLVESAQLVLKAELRKRGIQPPQLQTPEAEEVLSDVEPWVTVAQCATGPEAHILRARLESEDIPALVADEHLVTANWFLSNAVGGVRVRVPASYAERASTIVSAIEAGDYEIEDTDEPTLQCPACGSTHVNEHKKGWKIAFLVFYLLHIPMPYRRNEFRCSDCGKIFSMTTE